MIVPPFWWMFGVFVLLTFLRAGAEFNPLLRLVGCVLSVGYTAWICFGGVYFAFTPMGLGDLLFIALNLGFGVVAVFLVVLGFYGPLSQKPIWVVGLLFGLMLLHTWLMFLMLQNEGSDLVLIPGLWAVIPLSPVLLMFLLSLLVRPDFGQL